MHEECRPYQSKVFKAIGLDSNEYDRPATLFDSLYRRARADGLHVTAHCDVGQQDTHEHIKQVVSTVASTGLDRIDHGLNAAERAELIELIRGRDLGMTLCPHAYNRRNPLGYVFPLVRRLFDAGVKITINSDDPTYMHNMWISENLQLARHHCTFSDSEMVQLQYHAVEICWASNEVKCKLREELESVSKTHYPT
ncbi:putative deaminase [Pseudocercospora fuligena]|uniref:Putative deaminase n=1 Tax=Pseudocercospora fuligena TaxID=685502 RepID=A0A8H6RL35_9PEZI|nr:putative deaminase [Pseudocercospora fuligena]